MGPTLAGCQGVSSSSGSQSITEPETIALQYGLDGSLGYRLPIGTKLGFSQVKNGGVSRRYYTVQSPAGIKGSYLDIGTQKTEYLVPGCWGCGGNAKFDEAKYSNIWPLKVGNKTQFTITRPNGAQAKHSIEVVSVEDVAVQDSTYRTFVLKGKLTALGSDTFRAERADWWSPELGWVVKSTGRDSRGNRFSLVIVDVEIPQD